MGLRSTLVLKAIRYTGKDNYPLILNLEISHACNLFCEACGRVRSAKGGKLSVEQCTNAIDETKAPVIYFTGGEPLLNKSLPEVVDYALRNNRIVFVVTNGMLLKERVSNLTPHQNLALDVSIDGLKKEHDHIRGEGVFDRALEGIKEAKSRGHRIYTNTTIYKVNMGVLGDMMHLLDGLIDSFYFMPIFNYFESEESLTRDEIRKIGEELLKLYKRYPIANSISYLDFLKGKELKCTPWGTVTLDPRGWKSPCYFLTDDYYPTFDELRENTDWRRFEYKRDERCTMCFSHCGHEPTVIRKKGLLLKNFVKSIIT